MEVCCDCFALAQPIFPPAMIFVTVGSDIPFDRLIKAVDRWACAKNRHDIFAQIGTGGWQPQFVSFATLLEPPEFNECLASAQVVVGHAGMGTILSALQNSKPILVMPRRGYLGETRNDHQMATARCLLEGGRVNVAFDEEELYHHLDLLQDLEPMDKIAPFANLELTSKIHAFIHIGKAQHLL
jgi:UDP-N-acetylglucosamine transferase subunit ALG13